MIQHNIGAGQSGDTIVEVIIAVLIIATVLAGAFTLTNRSVRSVQDSEEHAEALQLLQGQVELLRYKASVAGALMPPNLMTLSTGFCIGTNGTIYQPASTNSNCLVNAQGSSGQANSFYSLSISSPSSAPASGATTVFNFVATWSALGGGTNAVQLSYKVEVTP